MRLIGRHNRHSRGVGSIIGAVFVALILLSGFTFYAFTQDVTQHYNDTMSSMNDMDWNRNQENIMIKQIAITDTKNLSITVENDGSIQSHLIWLGIFNKTATPENQTYQELNEFVRPSETVNIVSDFTVTAGNMYVIQLVTELGNTVESKFYPANFASCSLTLVTTPPTVYQGNNVTILFTVTLNDTAVDSIQSLTVTLNATPANLVQRVGNSSLSVSGLARGTSVFFWWIYNAVNTGTVTFNATYLQALAGTYALSTAEIVSAPQQGGQGNVIITGMNCTASQNPTGWNPVGLTQNVSGSISSLASNDADYFSFNSYLSGANINDFVDTNSSTVDNITNIGTQGNFAAQQAGPDKVNDTLTEVDTASASTSFGNPTAGTGSNFQAISGNRLWGGAFTSGSSAATVTQIVFYGCTSSGSINAKAVICNSSGYILTNGVSNVVSVTSTAGWQSAFTFASNPTISPNTTYWLMLIPTSNSIRLYYSSTSGGSEATDNTNNYGTPTNPTDAVKTGTRQDCIYANTTYASNYRLAIEEQWTNVTYTANQQLCIFAGNWTTADALELDGWNTTSSTWVVLNSSLVSNAWNNITLPTGLVTSNFTIRFTDGNQAGDTVQGSWSIDATLLHLWNNQYTAQVEFTDYADLQNWTQLVWLAGSSWTTSPVNVTIQLYNYMLSNYSSSGEDGYVFYVSNLTNADQCVNRTITSSPTDFRNNSTGYWKVEITGVAATQFQMNINWLELQDSYAYVNDTIPYKAWQWYTIQAFAVSGNPIPYTYVSLYANGTTVTFQNATDGNVLNPAWLRLDANGTFQLQVRSMTSSGEIFVLYVAVGTVVQQKTITQAAQ